MRVGVWRERRRTPWRTSQRRTRPKKDSTDKDTPADTLKDNPKVRMKDTLEDTPNFNK